MEETTETAAPITPGETETAETVTEVAAPKFSSESGGFHWGTGRRKSAVARVRIRDGAGLTVINGKELKNFFPNDQDQISVQAPLKATETEGKYDIFASVNGGGPTGQSGAVKMGLARALCSMDPALEAALREAGHLTRDSRMKERKKYGQRGARRRFQFSKR